MPDFLISTRKIKIHLLLIMLLVGFLSTPVMAGAIENIFVKDQNLLAVSHYNNLQKTDKITQEILQAINPQTPTQTPVLSLLASNILVENIKDIDAESWSEALYFTQPLEKNNDWVYIFHISSAEKYISSLLGTGNIRQEQKEDNITRYRQTDGLDSKVFYLGIVNNNLAVISKNSNAVVKALQLYQNPQISAKGLISNKDCDYSLTVHLNRYFLVNSRVLPRFFDMLQNDLLRDLAGTTAKSDNLLNIILAFLKTSLQDLVSEMAIVDIEANLQGTNLNIKANIDIQYGGSLHYALSAYQGSNDNIVNLLPEGSIMLSELKLWNEEYTQLLEGIANLSSTITNGVLDATTIDKASNILKLFQNAHPNSVQQGIIVPQENTERYGPAAVSVITFTDSSKLPEIFRESSDILNTGEFSEFLAEKGLRFDMDVSAVNTSKTDIPIKETRILMRSNYFKPPESLSKQQYFLSTIIDNKLITVTPLAPLTTPEYLDSKAFFVQTLIATVKSVTNKENSNNSELLKLTQPHIKKGTIYTISLNPLKYIQTAMQAEAIWPQPSAPNRLPIPWREFFQFFNAKDAGNKGAMNLTVNSERTNILIDFTLPKGSLITLLQSMLDLSSQSGL